MRGHEQRLAQSASDAAARPLGGRPGRPGQERHACPSQTAEGAQLLSPAGLLQLQRSAGNQSVASLLGELGAARLVGDVAHQAVPGFLQRHHSKDLTSTDEDDAEIYKIVAGRGAKNKRGKKVTAGSVVYIGQTCSMVGHRARFRQHLRTHSNWDSRTHEVELVERLKEVTPLETTAAERYWYDHFKLKGEPLENAIVPLTQAKFQQYSAQAGTFRGMAKNFPPGWQPKS